MSGLHRGGDGTIGISTRHPGPPSDAAFAIRIDFQKGSADPSRVFQAADAMIRALQGLDKALCVAVDPLIEPVMVLEDIEAGSLKVWLAEQLKRADDDGLKKLDWKPLVGKYLVRAKYAFIKWSNRDSDDGGLLGLAREIRAISKETDIRQLPDYAPPSIQELSTAARRIDDAKGLLQSGDKISYLSPNEPGLDFNLSVRWSSQELSDLAVNETTKFEKMPMILIVKRPDYLGTSKWDVRLGKKPISAKIEDAGWLARFQAREIDVRPGDALRCLVSIEQKYGFDNELILEEHVITSVEEVLENQIRQGDLGIDS
jgi:hypothetical protein